MAKKIKKQSSAEIRDTLQALELLRRLDVSQEGDASVNRQLELDLLSRLVEEEKK